MEVKRCACSEEPLSVKYFYKTTKNGKPIYKSPCMECFKKKARERHQRKKLEKEQSCLK